MPAPDPERSRSTELAPPDPRAQHRRPVDDMVRPLADAGLDDRVIWAVVEAAPDGIVMADLDGKVLLVNQRTEELFGYDRGELLGKSVDVLLPEALRELHHERRAGYAANPRVRAMGAGLDLLGRRRDGTEFRVEISLSPVAGPDGGPGAVIATVRDMTDRLVIEMENRRIRHQLVRTEDRERIARDLHDTVIQRLFVAGMTLQGAVARMDSADPLAVAEARSRVEGAIDDLDATIREVRSAIFALHTPPDGGPGLRGDLVRLGNEVRASLGFAPRLQFDGVVESVHPVVAEHMVPVVREALSNVARHAGASEVRIIVEVGDEVCLSVLDDGVGIPTSVSGGHGMANLRSRAEGLGGRFRAVRRPGGGTSIEWCVPSDPVV